MSEYDVDMHFRDYWDTYSVDAYSVDNARDTAIQRVVEELSQEEADRIDLIRVYKYGTDKLLAEYEIR